MANYRDEYAIPFPQGMVERKLFAGVPKQLFIPLLLLNIYLLVAKQMVTIILPSLAIYYIARRIYQFDPDFYKVYTRATKHKRLYQP
tara:strand:- start:956 stop:1216 length:261 start_codon:yes stop_codon:yes gene_type:complete